LDPVELRGWLIGIDGIGPKTASWIVRNATGSDEVAIVDIWLVRALTAAGVFPPNWNVNRDYGRYEGAFLSYARAGATRASALDWCIWELGRSVLPHVG
jgi:thermostable 8-oxoguanine DNA glycosylase